MLYYYLRLVAACARRSALALRWPRLLLGALGMLLTLLAHAQQKPTASTFFTDDAGARRAAAASPAAAALTASRALTLNEAGLRAALAAAPLESKGGAAKPLVLTLPLPDGTDARFAVREAPVMAPALAAKFPEIKTYVGVGLDDPQATVRLDMTPRGFHAQVLSAKTGDFFLDPANKADTKHYLSFWKRAMPGRQFECGTKGTGVALPDAGKGAAGAAGRTSGPVLRTYRLAVAATAEYTAYQGGTVARGLAAIVTSVNRVVGVYEKEVGVRFVLVSGNDALVYTDTATDPFDNSNANNVLLTQNQANTDAVIGTDNYDIGHVFSTASGGIASLGVVCLTGLKASGTTGISTPVGDAFDIDYVAHEIGHQCGANHTFDSVTGSCGGGNRNASTAYEPGSGTTIMAYAGICGATNTQLNSDAYFHVVSYEEILTYLGSTTCAATASTGNAPPSISLPASGLVLPVGTPFKLTANGYDTDGDAITYAWEEYDKTTTGGAPTAAQVAGVTAPLFRSFSPVASPTRYFPRLSDIINNTTTLGERLPTVTRELRFRVTVRDQHNGPQGVIGGVNSSAIVSLSSTSAAGPFVVTAPNAATANWAGGSTQPVTWDVAGTNANGVNCATVNIRLSTDGGLTYPTVLLAGAPNNGSATVTAPNVATTTARVLVEAADNYFFDISNADFTITAAATACAAPTNLSVGNITATSASVSFTASGAATSYVVTTSPATTSQTVTASPVSLTGLAPGVNYTVSIAASCADGTTATTATTSFATSAPPVCADIANLAVSGITATSATVTFTPTAAVTTYTVTTTPATSTQTITSSTVTLAGLLPGSAYTVNIVSNCASGGTTTSTVDFGTIPVNDECAAAIGLSVNSTCTTTSGTITGATESRPASGCSGSFSKSANDVWYSFVATTATLHNVRLISSFDGVLEVLAGDCSSLANLSCSDDVGPGAENVQLTGLTPGTRYYVRVYPYTQNAATMTTGTFTLCVTALSDLVVSDTRAIEGAYRNVTVTSTGAASLSNDLYVSGTMTVQSGGSVRTDDVSYYIRGNGRFVLSAGATLIETNLAGITNTGSGGFFLSGNNPMQLSTNANYVFGGSSAQVTGDLMPIRARNFTVNNSSGVTLTRNLAVAQVLRLQSGNLALDGKSLLLPSSAAGTALVDNSGGGAVTGATASMQRALTGGVTGPAYRHFSSPVASVAFDSLRTGGTAPAVNAAYNTSATPGTSLPYPTLFGYDETRIATAASNYDDFNKGWFSPASLSETMQPGKGYTVNVPVGSTPVRFTGTFNTGDQGSGPLTRGTSADAGWQLLGNPYPSPIDWSTVAAAQRPGLDAAMYVFQSTGQYTGTYRSYVNGIGGTAAQIEAGSGYFVRVSTAGTTGAVNLTNANRVTTFGSQNAFGRTTADLRPQLQLHVANAAGLGDDAYLYVEAGATAGVDREYDAVKLPNSTGLNLAVLAGTTPLAVQGLPTLAGTTEVVLPLTLAVPTAGSFTFEVADLANFGATTVYLRDAATGTQQALAAGTRYSFSVADAAAAPTGRFALVLRPAPQATPGPLAVTQVSVHPNPARVSFTVEVPAVPAADYVEAVLLNALGQVVRRQSAALPASGAQFTVPATGLVTGVYLLRLTAGDTTVTKRVVIE